MASTMAELEEGHSHRPHSVYSSTRHVTDHANMKPPKYILKHDQPQPTKALDHHDPPSLISPMPTHLPYVTAYVTLTLAQK